LQICLFYTAVCKIGELPEGSRKTSEGTSSNQVLASFILMCFLRLKVCELSLVIISYTLKLTFFEVLVNKPLLGNELVTFQTNPIWQRLVKCAYLVTPNMATTNILTK